MPNNKLILRSVNSPWVSPFNDITTGSVLSWADVDNNFIYLKGEIIHSGYTSGNSLILEKINGNTINLDLEQFGDEGNRWYVPANEVVEVPSNYQSFIYGDLYLEGLVKLNDNSQLVVLNGDIIMNGGSISGNGTTLLVDLPMFDTKLVNGYFDSGILSLVDNTNNIITVNLSSLEFTGNTSSSCINNLWVTNIYGCSPLNIQNDLIINGSVSADEYIGNIILDEGNLTTFSGTILKTGTGTTTQGKIYYLNNSNGWSLTNSNSILTSDGLLGIAVGSNPSVDGMLVNGLAKNVLYTGITGSPLYLSTTDGDITDYPLSGSGFVVRVVGYKLSTDGSILFNPEPILVEL